MQVIADKAGGAGADRTGGAGRAGVGLASFVLPLLSSLSWQSICVQSMCVSGDGSFGSGLGSSCGCGGFGFGSAI